MMVHLRRSLALLKKSGRNQRSYVYTEPFTSMVFRVGTRAIRYNVNIALNYIKS